MLIVDWLIWSKKTGSGMGRASHKVVLTKGFLVHKTSFIRTRRGCGWFSRHPEGLPTQSLLGCWMDSEVFARRTPPDSGMHNRHGMGFRLEWATGRHLKLGAQLSPRACKTWWGKNSLSLCRIHFNYSWGLAGPDQSHLGLDREYKCQAG